MKNILNLCKENKLYLIEDCAQSHGAKYKNKYAGTFGHFGCFSFYPTKNLGCLGDGGAIISKLKAFDTEVKKFRNYGSIRRYQNEIIGSNSRLDEIQALFLNTKLKHLNNINKHKRKLANIYNSKLSNKFIKPKIEKNYYDVYYVYNIRISNRNSLIKFLNKNKIKTDIHYPMPPYKQKAVEHIFGIKKFPITEEIHNTTLSLPISFMHKEKDIKKICDIMNSF